VTDEKRVAIHEAGHTVMAAILGDPVDVVTIVPNGSTKGHTVTRPDTAMTKLLIAASGRIAEEIEFGHSRNGRDGDHEKVFVAQGLIPWDEIRGVSRWLLSLHWHCVEALSDELIAKKTLSGKEVRALFGDVLPKYAGVTGAMWA